MSKYKINYGNLSNELNMGKSILFCIWGQLRGSNTSGPMYEKFINFGHHDEFKMSDLTIEIIREKIKNKEMFYDHFVDKSSTNKWKSDDKLKTVKTEILPKYLVENKKKYNEWFCS